MIFGIYDRSTWLLLERCPFHLLSAAVADWVDLGFDVEIESPYTSQESLCQDM